MINDYKWELYNIAEDFSQNNDLAAKNPDKLKEMQALFLAEAAKYQVLAVGQLGSPAPRDAAAERDRRPNRFHLYTGENAGIPVGNAPSILDKDYTITAEIPFPKAARRE